MKKVLFLLISFCFPNLSICHERVDSLPKSHSCFNKAIQKVSGLLDYSAKPYEGADPFYQNLCREVCEVLDIQEEIKIKKLPSTSNSIFNFVAAYALVNTIVINEPVLNTRSYGCKRFTLFHEIMHIKYQDYAKISLGEIAALSSYFLLKYVTNNYGPDFTRMISSSISGFWNVIPAFIVAGAAGRFLSTNAEGRADFQAAYACNCYQCVEDEIDRRIKTIESGDVTNFILMMQKNLLLNGGYLRPDDLKIIASELKKTEALCSYHSN